MHMIGVQRQIMLVCPVKSNVLNGEFSEGCDTSTASFSQSSIFAHFTKSTTRSITKKEEDKMKSVRDLQQCEAILNPAYSLTPLHFDQSVGSKVCNTSVISGP